MEDPTSVLGGGNASEKKVRQRRREINIALFLRGRISPLLDGSSSPAEFKEGAEREAEEIAGGAFGTPFLTAIGFALEVEAEEFLGFQQSFLGLDGHAARAKKRVNSVTENIQVSSHLKMDLIQQCDAAPDGGNVAKYIP